ncbi:MAG TPA: hypothetical protein PLH11_07185 [Gemmobacter sp.]|nr:hypothetical protein [Gemmobacter sp.]
MSLLDDWLSYVEKPSRFDKHHFESLMLELDNAESLHQAFDGLRNGAAFVSRIMDFRARADFNGTYLLPPPPPHTHTQVVTPHAYELAAQYRDAVADRLTELDYTQASAIARSRVVEISSRDFQREKELGRLRVHDVETMLGDDFIDCYAEFPRWILGLREAVYMMTTFPAITRYLLWPIVKYPLDETPAAELWLMGHWVEFCEDRTLLTMGGAG